MRPSWGERLENSIKGSTVSTAACFVSLCDRERNASASPCASSMCVHSISLESLSKPYQVSFDTILGLFWRFDAWRAQCVCVCESERERARARARQTEREHARASESERESERERERPRERRTDRERACQRESARTRARESKSESERRDRERERGERV